VLCCACIITRLVNTQFIFKSWKCNVCTIQSYARQFVIAKKMESFRLLSTKPTIQWFAYHLWCNKFLLLNQPYPILCRQSRTTVIPGCVISRCTLCIRTVCQYSAPQNKGRFLSRLDEIHACMYSDHGNERPGGNMI